MSSSENILRRIRLFVTDADGTLMGTRPEFEQYRSFRARMNELRKTYGILWVVCTGRSLAGYKHIFRPMHIFGIKPDYIIVNHALIFECKKWGYLPHWTWNAGILWLQWKDELAVRRALSKIRKIVVVRNPFARVFTANKQRVCFRFDDDGAAAFGAEILREEVRRYKFLQVFEAPGEISVRVIPFTKGLAVLELARHLGVANPEILVVGDGHNDISMMELDPPCYTACPANAAAEVVATVHRKHGHIAAEKHMNGVMEVLAAYEQGRLNDKLPVDWEESDTPTSTRPRSRGIRSFMGTTILLLLVLYTTLLVVASFIQIPGRKQILKPYFNIVENVCKGWRYFDRPVH